MADDEKKSFMKEVKPNMEKRKKAVIYGLCFGTAIILTSLALYPGIQVTDEGEWQVIWSGNLAAAEADPGSGASGFLEISVKKP